MLIQPQCEPYLECLARNVSQVKELSIARPVKPDQALPEPSTEQVTPLHPYDFVLSTAVSIFSTLR